MNRLLLSLLIAVPVVSSVAAAQGVTVRQPIAVKAKVGSGSGLGVSAEVPLGSRLRATVGLSQGKISGGAKYFLNGNNYLAGEAGFSAGRLSDVNALIGHRFDTQSVFFDVEGGVNLKAGAPVLGAGAGIKF